MKRLFYIVAVTAMTLCAACKPSEANYKMAYESAKQKQLTGDSLIDAGLTDQQRPRLMVFGGDTLPVVTDYVGYTKDGGADTNRAIVKRYCVVVGKFKQVFNARSMRERLNAQGYSNAFVLHNNMKDYFVIAASTRDHHEARMLLDSIAADKNMVLKAPYPYILQPRHLAR